MIALVVLAGVLVGLVSTSEAATINAASCSEADINTAIGAPGSGAANDDIVVVPAGNCNINLIAVRGKRITLQGAGKTPDGTSLSAAQALCAAGGQTSYTCLTDVSPKDADGSGRTVNGFTYFNKSMIIYRDMLDGAAGTGVTRITGFTFFGGTGSGDGSNNGIILLETGSTDQLRYDNNAMYTTRTSGLKVIGCLKGVFDHNYWSMSNEAYATYSFNNAYCPYGTGYSNTYGDARWTVGAQFGTADFLFLEDNRYDFDGYCTGGAGGGLGISPSIDQFAASAIVFRYNTVNNTYITTHGLMGRHRGARAGEIYRNTFVRGSCVNGNQTDAFGIGSGAWLVHNNTVTGTYTNIATMTINRAGAPYAPWGTCNGTSVWDGNTSPAGYPCMDQPGRGPGDLVSGDTATNQTLGSATYPRQAIEKSYCWGNTLNGVTTGCNTFNSSYVQLGREFENSALSGYVEYTYPHPLVGGGSTASATITSPVAGSNQTASTTFTVSGTATAGTGSLTRVDVYIDGTLTCSDTVASFSPWSCTATAPATAGAYTLTAKATDSDGQGPASTGVSVNVVTGGGGSAKSWRYGSQGLK